MASPFDASIPETYALPPVPEVYGTDPTVCVLDAFRIAAAKSVAEACGIEVGRAYEGVDIMKKQGDFYVALPRFRLGGKPDVWAKKVVDEFKPNQYLSKCTSTGGFVTFFVNQDTFNFHVLRQIRLASPHEDPNAGPLKPLDPAAHKTGYGCNQSGKGKKALIEFSSVNIAKPFHAGHLRSTIIGAFLANLYEANGWEVIRVNYLGDWGKQFGLLALGFQRFGSEEELEADAIKHLYDVYVRINAEAEADPAIHDDARAFFKRMEDGDEEALGLWRRFRDFSIQKLEQMYAKLNIHFDVYAGESLVSPESMKRQVDLLEEKNLLCTDRGAVLANLEEQKLGKVVVRKADGTSIYITRDLGEALERYEKYKFDKMIYVIAAQQNFHCQQFFKMLELMGYEWADRLEHVNFGMVLGMSTRKGTVKFLDDILQEATTAMHEQMSKNEDKYKQIENPEEVSEIIGQTAVKIQDMSAKRINDYEFNISRMTSFEGDTGPYIQYSHVRLCSVQRKNPNILVPDDLTKINVSLLSEPKAREIIYVISTYPQVIRDAFIDYQPSTIVTFCFKLCHLVSQAWEVLKVQGQEEDLALARLYLFVCTRDVLSSAMRLLSLTPLERM
ncbi:arginyl-tRNA synthetase [Naganishia albida]|nr:arginyl-tRNA synthetase [Naganishia albida]